jgi:SAM-dependent methyltransferase
MDPQPDPGTVDLAIEKHSAGYYAVNAAARLRWVGRFQPAGTLLEVGCGHGYFLAAAREAGYRVTGVEPDPTAAHSARQRYGIEVEEAFIEESRLPDAAFDVVFHVDLLSHFPDPVLAVAAMVRRVRPGGYLCFEVGGQKPLANLYYRMNGTAGYPHHLWLYEERGLRSLLEDAGLDVVEIRRFGLLADVTLHVAARFIQRVFAQLGVGRSGHGSAGRGRTRSAWDRLQHLSRYILGRGMPPLGPQTLWVAARRPERDDDASRA